MAYIVLSYTKYRHSSTIPPKYFGFAEVLLRRAGLKAGPAGRVRADKRTPGGGGAGWRARRRGWLIVKVVRLFLFTIRRSMGILQRAGVDAACEREDTDEEIRLTIRIPRTGAAKTA